MIAPASTAVSMVARLPRVSQELVYLSGGALFTLVLFFGLARIETGPAAPVATELMDMRLAAMPFESPPPKPTEDVTPTDAPSAPLAGIDPGASESPIHIAVTPPELAAIFPAGDAPPSATIDTRHLYADFRPKVEIESSFDRIFDRSEVDQPPHVLSRDDPVVPPSLRGNANSLRVVLLIVVNQHGQPGNARVLTSSGIGEFDRIVADSVKSTWVFSPAVKAGKPVRCLVQQIVTVRWSAGSRFTTQ